MGRPRLKVNVSEFVTMYQSGASLSTIADHFQISIPSVRMLRIRYNIPLRKWHVRFDQNEYRRLFHENVPYKEIAQQLHISRYSVIEIRKRLGLPNRNSLRQKVKNEQ